MPASSTAPELQVQSQSMLQQVKFNENIQNVQMHMCALKVNFESTILF